MDRKLDIIPLKEWNLFNLAVFDVISCHLKFHYCFGESGFVCFSFMTAISFSTQCFYKPFS